MINTRLPVHHAGNGVGSYRIPMEVSGWQAKESLVGLAPEARAFIDPKSGNFAAAGRPVPLTNGVLQSAFACIDDKQSWLLDYPPVVKSNGPDCFRIDFVNYGGFLFDQQGGYLEHSVNPW
ncbi:MAG: hypothetical protein KC910_18155 [Candidatus Eremiobacteraeota bacterium]|nr:hypothetical protein [Candidatus Eremiobacteraeota bacterium]